MPSYKKYAMLMSTIGMMLLLVGFTYSFFNYTRTGGSNAVAVGRLNFVTSQNSTINLSNVFPIDSANVNTDTDNVGTVVVTITGDTDLDKGIEYLVSSVDTNLITPSGTTIPLSISITPSGLGNSSTNYFSARESTSSSIYKLMVENTLADDEMLMVGYIAPNDPVGTIAGVNGSITIKAYFDKDKILITDTPEESATIAGNRTIVSTTDWNSFISNGVSFKVKVEANEGFWVANSLEFLMSKKAVLDNIDSTYVDSQNMTGYGPNANPGIAFNYSSSDKNGKGIYMLANTANDTNPIIYYRGDVNDNYVLFANKCWKIVRTTNTGGTKLVYNGEPQPYMSYLPENAYNVSNIYNLTYNSQTSTWEGTTTNQGLTFESTLSEAANDYAMDLVIGSNSGCNEEIYILKNDTQLFYKSAGNETLSLHFDEFGSISTSDVIKVYLYQSCSPSNRSVSYKLRMYHSLDTPLGIRCDNIGTDTRITVNVSGTPTSEFKFNDNKTSLAYNGYMYGTVYSYSTSSWTEDIKYGSGFTHDGTSYKLTNTSGSCDATHHYSCFLTDANATCNEIRYYYSSGKYITLTGGDGIEEAIAKMQTNTNSSIAKQMLDSWYAANLTSYTNKLEDAIWCNDRSFDESNNSGWIATGSLSTPLFYGSYSRSGYNIMNYNTLYKPDTICVNKNDRFTVSNPEGNQKLTYPIGLLTSDEYFLAGGTSSSNTTYYLYNGDYNWTLSPIGFASNNKSNQYYQAPDGMLSYNATDLAFPLRPAISLKKGQNISSGTGTATDPYVID